jgi:hypothetical protein
MCSRFDTGKEGNIHHANSFSSQPILYSNELSWLTGQELPYFTTDWQRAYIPPCTVPNLNSASIIFTSQWQHDSPSNLATFSNLTATTPSESPQDLDIKNTHIRDNSGCETPQTSPTPHDRVSSSSCSSTQSSVRRDFERLPDELSQCEPSEHKSRTPENCAKYAFFCLSHM